jgi:hypothetical protein
MVQRDRRWSTRQVQASRPGRGDSLVACPWPLQTRATKSDVLYQMTAMVPQCVPLGFQEAGTVAEGVVRISCREPDTVTFYDGRRCNITNSCPASANNTMPYGTGPQFATDHDMGDICVDFESLVASLGDPIK